MQNANDDDSGDNSKAGKYRLRDTSGGNTTNQNSHQSPTPSIKNQKSKAKSQASQTARAHAKAKKQNPTKANGANKTGSRGMIKHRSNSTKPTGATHRIKGNYNAETGGTAALNGIQHAGNGIQHVGNGITRLGGGNPSPISKVNHGYDTNLDGSVGNANGGVLGNNYDSLPTGNSNDNGTTTTSDVDGNNDVTGQTTGDKGTTPTPTNPNSPVNNNGASGNGSTGLMNGNTGTTTTGGNQPNFTPTTNTVGGQDAIMATTGNVGGGSPANNDGATQNFGQMAGIANTPTTPTGNTGTTTTADTTGANDVADQTIANNVAGSNYTPNTATGAKNYTQHVDDGTTVLNDDSVDNLGGNMTGNHGGMNTHIARVHDHHTIINHNIHHQGHHYNPNAGTFGYSNLKPQSNGDRGLNFANLALKHKNDK